MGELAETYARLDRQADRLARVTRWAFIILAVGWIGLLVWVTLQS